MASSSTFQQPVNALETISISRKKSSKNDKRVSFQHALDSRKRFITDSSGLELEKLLNLPESDIHSISSGRSASTTTRRPGDVYNGTSSNRPLGLLPGKRKRDTWKQLGVFTMGGVVNNDTSKTKSKLTDSNNTAEPPKSSFKSINKVIRIRDQRKYPMPTPVPHDHGSRPMPHPSAMIAEDDPEYLSTLAQCNLKEYSNSEPLRRGDVRAVDRQLQPLVGDPTLHITADQALWNSRGTIGWRGGGAGKPLQTSANLFQSKRNLEYLSFFQPANLNKRNLFTDCRNAKDYEPCERCALRGTRCRHCKAIRTGGGYIILDGFEDSMFMGQDGSMRFSDSAGSRQYLRSAMSSRRRNRSSGLGDSEDERLYFDESGRETGEDGFDRFDDNRGRRRGTGGRDGEDWSPDGTLSSRGTGRRGNGAMDGADSRGSRGLKDIDGISEVNGEDSSGIGGRLNTSRGQNRNSTSNGGGSLGAEVDGDGSQGDSRTKGNHNDRLSRGGDGSEYDEDGDMSNTDGSRSKRTLKHGADGLKDTGDGSHDGKTKFGKGGLEKDKMDHGRGSEDDHGKSNIKGSSKRRGDLTGYTDDTDHGDSTHRVGFVSQDDDPPSTGHSTYDLMRFKSKRDKVRAKSCTLRELKGIDPLDYLAKYCIIDQEKVPHYQRVFENVDQDEDNEISVMELDFALKAVNYNLISDAELVYVNKVLELTGRYALNFQLFTLVAALSEKVVSLDDMVKRLVNTMDFEALETKMKKCKELFYLLANREEDEEDGIVTSAALGIELHAGGLTQEHVEYVIDHLDQEQKGKIEFLDYLVYVPLFVEIHGNISSNPLDFSRTK